MKSVAVFFCIASHRIAAHFLPPIPVPELRGSANQRQSTEAHDLQTGSSKDVPSDEVHNIDSQFIRRRRQEDASLPAMMLYLSHLFHHHEPPMYHHQMAAAALQQQAQQQLRLQTLSAQILNFVNAQNKAQDAAANNYHDNVLQLLVRIVRTVDADHSQTGVLSRMLAKIIADNKQKEEQSAPAPVESDGDSLHDFLQQQVEKSSQPENIKFLLDWLSQHREHEPEDADKLESSMTQILKLPPQQTQEQQQDPSQLGADLETLMGLNDKYITEHGNAFKI